MAGQGHKALGLRNAPSLESRYLLGSYYRFGPMTAVLYSFKKQQNENISFNSANLSFNSSSKHFYDYMLYPSSLD